MPRRHLEVAAIAIACFVVGYTLWPPGHVYWTALAGVVGDSLALVAVAVLAGLAGVAITPATDVRLANLAAGGAVAYLAGMALVEATTTPDSPVHLSLSAWLLGCPLSGALAERSLPASYRIRSDG